MTALANPVASNIKQTMEVGIIKLLCQSTLCSSLRRDHKYRSLTEAF